MKFLPPLWKKIAPRNQRARMGQAKKGKIKSTRFGVGALLDLLQARI
jgi:hypothetical protein